MSWFISIPTPLLHSAIFSCLCECWLGIASDISLFWCFYSPARYNKVVYSGIGLPLCHHRSQECISATFKSSWRGSSPKWVLVDMHVEPQWANRHLLPPHIDKKRKEPKMTPRLIALVKQVAELHDVGLRVCHYAKEFNHRRIHPFGRQEKLAYDYPRLADPSREPTTIKIFNLYFLLLMIGYFDLINIFCSHSSDLGGDRSACGMPI
jgi:hypothetical protein